MIIEDRRYGLGQELKQFRQKELDLSLVELGEILDTDKTNLWFLEKGKRKRVDIDMFFVLVDLGLPIHRLLNPETKRKVAEYLKLKKFKKELRKNPETKFRFDVFCGINKEYIEKNYVDGVLEHIKR